MYLLPFLVWSTDLSYVFLCVCLCVCVCVCVFYVFVLFAHCANGFQIYRRNIP